MRPIPTVQFDTISIPVVRRGRHVFLLARDGTALGQGVAPNRLGPLSPETIESLRWHEAARVCLNRIKAEAVHFRLRGPWEAKAFAMKCHFRERAASAARRGPRPPRRRRPTPRTWAEAAPVMVSRLYGQAYGALRPAAWERWARGKIRLLNQRRCACLRRHPRH